MDEVDPPLDDRPDGNPESPNKEGDKNGFNPAAAAAAAAAAADDEEEDDDDVPYREGNKEAI